MFLLLARLSANSGFNKTLMLYSKLSRLQLLVKRRKDKKRSGKSYIVANVDDVSHCVVGWRVASGDILRRTYLRLSIKIINE